MLKPNVAKPKGNKPKKAKIKKWAKRVKITKNIVLSLGFPGPKNPQIVVKIFQSPFCSEVMRE